ncbi:hypothetical protein BGX23_003005 [Mortierella sp. AD031]|nr:hypothetical protein BGX23_003005 [Mortierella sp. AD031]
MLPEEIQRAIVDFLEPHDLARLLCVSKDWNQSCMALLWRTLDVTDLRRCRWFSCVQALQALPCHGHHTRTLQIVNSYTLIPFQDPGVIPDLLLTRLELSTPSQFNYLDDTDTARLIQLLERCPALQHLHIGRLCRHPGQLLLAIDKHLPRLKTLSLFNLPRTGQPFGREHYPRIASRLLKAFLDNLPSELEYVALGARAFWSEPVSAESAAPLEFILSFEQDEVDYLDFEQHFGAGNVQGHRQLRVLWIRGMDGDQDKVLPAFLRSCPSLEVTDIIERVVVSKEVQAALEEVMGYRLQNLNIEALGESEWGTDVDIAKTISTAASSITGHSFRSVWNHVTIRRDYSSNMKATAEAIARSCQKRLVNLFISNASDMESIDIQLILSTTQSLRVFDSRTTFPPPRLAASDMVATPWACRWLTTLRIRICGIPRPDLKINEQGLVLATKERVAGSSGDGVLGRKSVQHRCISI